MRLQCTNCNHEFIGKEEANAIYLCPKCFEYVNINCEYGFGPIVPCIIYLGDREIGKITGCESYRLDSLSLNIHCDLEKGYKNLEVYIEAIEIIKKELMKCK